MSADKQRILLEINRLASGGKAPGVRAFETATGIKESDWCPDIWLRWGDAFKEAGFAPNVMVEARSEESLLESYAGLARRLGHVPIRGELTRESRANTSFPQ